MPEIVRFAERLVLVLLAAWVIARLMPTFSFHPQVLLLLLGELSAVFFLLIQRPGRWASSPYTTLIAFLGTGVPLCVNPQGVTLAPDWLTATLMLAGTAISVTAKLSLRRSFGLVPANRGVKVRGAYRFVRHPMYAGYILNHIGFLLLFLSSWNIVVYALSWYLLYLRVVEEERFLLDDPEYVAYTKAVRARLVPGLI